MLREQGYHHMDRAPSARRGRAVKSPTTTLDEILRKWDRSTKTARARILIEFAKANQGKTGPQLEREYGNGASLFLTRVSAWLRITYLVGFAVHEALQVITIFVDASSGHRFLAEFIEVGGLITVMDILSVEQLTDEVKMSAVMLLTKVAAQGRGCKELICELNGVDVVLAYLLTAEQAHLQLHAQQLVVTLGRGNPNYASHVMERLLGALNSSSEGARATCAQAVRMLLSTNHPAGSYFPLVYHASEAAAGMLDAPGEEVQYEAAECLKLLRWYQGGDLQILSSLSTCMSLSGDLEYEGVPTMLDPGAALEPLHEGEEEEGGGGAAAAGPGEGEGLAGEASGGGGGGEYNKGGILRPQPSGTSDLNGGLKSASFAKSVRYANTEVSEASSVNGWGSEAGGDAGGEGSVHSAAAPAGPRPDYVRQAAAAGFLAQQAWGIAAESPSLRQRLTDQPMVKVVLAALGNTLHFPSQQAAQRLLNALLALDRDAALASVDALLGPSFVKLLVDHPDSILERLPTEHLVAMRALGSEVRSARRPLSRDFTFSALDAGSLGGVVDAGGGADPRDTVFLTQQEPGQAGVDGDGVEGGSSLAEQQLV